MAKVAEFLAGRISNPGAETELQGLTREEFVAILTALETEIDTLAPYLPRFADWKRSKETFPPPSGYSSWLVVYAENAVYIGFSRESGPFVMLIQLCIDLRLFRNQLFSSVAKRVGVSWVDRHGTSAEWERRTMEGSLPRKVSVSRNRARRLFRNGSSYDYALWVVALRWIMDSRTGLTGAEADALRKTVDREYVAQTGQSLPKVPWGWWRADQERPPLRSGVVPRGIRLKPTRE